MITWDSIITDLGGTGEVAKALGQWPSTVSGWRTRAGGIPATHWANIVAMASNLEQYHITLRVLAELAAQKHVA